MILEAQGSSLLSAEADCLQFPAERTGSLCPGDRQGEQFQVRSLSGKLISLISEIPTSSLISQKPPGVLEEEWRAGIARNFMPNRIWR